MINRRRIRRYYNKHPFKAQAWETAITFGLAAGTGAIALYALRWPWWVWAAVWVPAYLAFVFGRFHPALRSRKEIKWMKARERAMYAFDPDWVVPPGDLLKEALDERGMDEAAFARRVGLTVGNMRLLLIGDLALTEEMARRFEIELGIHARLWINLERNYREGLSQGKTLLR
jgi:plasmid maintenance system antidote protein VapI